MPQHLRFKNIHPSTVGAAERLFQAKPWQGDMEEQEEAAQRFLSDVAEVYGVSTPEFDLRAPGWFSDDPYSYTPEQTRTDSFDHVTVDVSARISMMSWSILNLFYCTRIHLIATGAATAADDDPEMDAVGWACSLFYRVKPVMFRARVREGRILHVTARETYKAETWEKLEAAGVTDGDDLAVSWQAARDIVNEVPRPSDDEPADLDTQDEPDTDHSYESDVSEGLAEIDVQDEEDSRAGEIFEDVRPSEAAMAASDDDGLDSLNRDQVRALAVANGIPRGDRNKEQLIVALRQANVTA